MDSCPVCGGKKYKGGVRCQECGFDIPACFSGGGSSIKGLDAQISSFLCYLGLWVTGLLFVLLEKKNRQVRFNAWQSLVTFGGISIFLFLYRSVTSLVDSTFLEVIYIFLWLGALILWALILLKTYQGEKVKLPVIGEWIEERFL